MEIDPQSVLIVDDDELFREALASFLKAEGFKVTIAGAPERVKPLLARRAFAVGLIDLRTPQIDGLEIIRYLRTFSPGTQCIVLAGHASRDSAVEAVNLGAYGYLRKPCEIDQLLVTVKRASERVAASRELGRERSEKSRKVAARTRRLHAEKEALSRRLKSMDRFFLGLARRLTAELNLIHDESGESEGSAEGDPSLSRERIGRLLRFSEDLLELAHIQNGRRTAQKEPVAVSELLRTCRERLAAEYPAEPPPLIRDVLPGETIWTDPEMAVRILMELARYAKDGAPDRPILLDAVRAENRFRLSLSREGIAISEKTLERFLSGDAFPDIQTPGDIDLSFPMAWRLSALLGGQITVECHLESGNRFTLSLPDRQTKDSSEIVSRKPAEAADGAPSKATILLAEDNPESAAVMADYVRSRGYAVRTALTGREALEGARQNPPDLMLMDVQMPDMDGLEAIRNLRADPQLRFVPVIAITALAMAGDRERCLSAGANAYMSKPVRLRTLIKTVENFLALSPENSHGQRAGHSDC
ncbi:MAG: response regulator [Desulfococcaceae bacterium]